MLTEDQVVLAVCAYLERSGWTVVSRALATERGDDIVAERGGNRHIVEAKGGGSSKEGTRRFGKEFSLGQCQVNVGMASLRAMRVASAEDGTQAAIAFPDSANYRRVLEPVLAALRRINVTVYLVSSDLAVNTL